MIETNLEWFSFIEKEPDTDSIIAILFGNIDDLEKINLKICHVGGTGNFTCFHDSLYINKLSCCTEIWAYFDPRYISD